MALGPLVFVQLVQPMATCALCHQTAAHLALAAQRRSLGRTALDMGTVGSDLYVGSNALCHGGGSVFCTCL